MKERLLPDSFWLPPNRPNNNIRKPAPSNELFETRTGLITITSPPDTNLLFSLFKILEQSKQHKTPECLANRLILKKSKERQPTEIRSKHFETTTDSSEEGVEDEDLMVEQQQQHHQQQKQLKIMDDPYLSLKQEHTVMGTKMLKLNENYSDLLSDLVVNL